MSDEVQSLFETFDPQALEDVRMFEQAYRDFRYACGASEEGIRKALIYDVSDIFYQYKDIFLRTAKKLGTL